MVLAGMVTINAACSAKVLTFFRGVEGILVGNIFDLILQSAPRQHRLVAVNAVDRVFECSLHGRVLVMFIEDCA